MYSVTEYDPAYPVSLQKPVKRGWRGAAEFQFEIVLFLLLLATFAAVRFQDAILLKTITLKPDSSLYTVRYYGDAPHGGTSTVTVDPLRLLHWRCDVRAAYAYPYCGYELLLDDKTPEKGYDLSRLQSLTINLDFRGPSDTFRIYFKNFDPRYSKPGLPDTLKFNKVEVSAQPGHNIVQLKKSDFAVAEWWVTQNKIKPELSHVQLDNVTEFQFQTGTQAPPGTYVFKVDSIVLRVRVIAQATWYAAILAAWAVLIGAYLLFRILKMRSDLEQRRQSQAAALRLAQYAEESARRDYLTNLFNRSGIIDLYHPLAMNRRTDGALAVILLDVDHFKLVNDRFGHSAGDQVLAGIAKILTDNTRSGDIVGRWGGEEFLLICSISDQDAAMNIAAKLRIGIEAHDFPVVGHVTASMGVYCCVGQVGALEQIVSYADAALYAAKEQGRNRAVMYQPFMREAA
jgi:diguanylate cyclase (GGDEF)-like protein